MLVAPWNSRACGTVNSRCVKLLMFAPPWKSSAAEMQKSPSNYLSRDVSVLLGLDESESHRKELCQFRKSCNCGYNYWGSRS
jgi:hypothetical protein